MSAKQRTRIKYLKVTSNKESKEFLQFQPRAYLKTERPSPALHVTKATNEECRTTARDTGGQ